jgi:hypothetical protein
MEMLREVLDPPHMLGMMVGTHMHNGIVLWHLWSGETLADQTIEKFALFATFTCFGSANA